MLGTYKGLVDSVPPNADKEASAKLFQDTVGAFIRDPKDGLSGKPGWPMFNPDGRPSKWFFKCMAWR